MPVKTIHPNPDAVAVLASGGADSAVLLGMMAQRFAVVQPLYVRCGLAWEHVEYVHLCRYVDVLARRLSVGRIREPTALELPIGDLYAEHWSVTGQGVPDQATPDEAVYLPGRNLLLLAKAAVYCALHHVGVIACGQLSGNPFPDATPSFFSGMAAVAGQAVALPGLRVITPLLELKKPDVLRRGAELGLPLEESFSCLSPVPSPPGEADSPPGAQPDPRYSLSWHCGRCNKCFERRQAFASAGLPDPTCYADNTMEVRR